MHWQYDPDSLSRSRNQWARWLPVQITQNTGTKIRWRNICRQNAECMIRNCFFVCIRTDHTISCSIWISKCISKGDHRISLCHYIWISESRCFYLHPTCFQKSGFFWHQTPPDDCFYPAFSAMLHRCCHLKTAHSRQWIPPQTELLLRIKSSCPLSAAISPVHPISSSLHPL